MREPLAPGTLLGEFQLGNLIGKGSFSLTYAATQGPWRLPVAVKEYFPEGRQRSHFSQADFQDGVAAFLQEGETLERFSHPGVVRVLGHLRANQTAYLIEELLEGIPLGEGLRQAGSMSLRRMLDLASQVGQAMLLVHASGLIHSDLKPDNLFLTRQGRYVILDFGTARSGREQLSQREVSPGFSPPEQYQRGPLTPAADVYALAASLYQLSCGSPPPEAYQRREGAPLDSLEMLSEKLRQALLQALHLDPLQRTQSMRAFLTQLGLDVTPRAVQADFPGFTEVARKAAHSGGVHALCLDAGRGLLYSAGRDGCWRSWSWPGLDPLTQVKAHDSPILCLALSSDGGYLVSGAQDGTVRLWSTRTEGGEGFLLLGQGPAVNSLAFHPQLGLVAAALLNGECCLLGPSLDKPNRWSAHQGSANSLAIDPTGNWLATAGDDKAVHLWSLPEGTYGGSLLGHASRIQGVRFIQGGSGLLTCCADMTVRAWELEEKREVRCLRGHKGMIWTAEGHDNLVLTACADRALRAFRLDGGRLILQTEAHEQWVRCLAWDETAQIVVSGGGDGKICQWQIPAGSSC